jgi:hypothetical protein
MGFGALAQTQDRVLVAQATTDKPATGTPETTPDVPKPQPAKADTPAKSDAPEVAKSDDTAKSESGDEDPGEEVTWEGLFAQLGKVITDFRTVGILAGFIALVSLLVMVLRFKPLDAWLEKKGWKKWKAVIAAFLGGVLTMLSAVAGGEGWVAAAIAGLAGALTALSSVGLHNIFTAGNTK